MQRTGKRKGSGTSAKRCFPLSVEDGMAATTSQKVHNSTMLPISIHEPQTLGAKSLVTCQLDDDIPNFKQRSI